MLSMVWLLHEDGFHIAENTSGPVVTSIKNEAGATASEFSDLANSRQPPSYTAANETPLTRMLAVS